MSICAPVVRRREYGGILTGLNQETHIVSKNTICPWDERPTLDAATSYSKPFPDSAVGAVHRAPGCYPAGSRALC
jgi:hypothetical protein